MTKREKKITLGDAVLGRLPRYASKRQLIDMRYFNMQEIAKGGKQMMRAVQ